MNQYEYRDADGNVILTKVKVAQVQSCPSCGSTRIKDKGSFDKCMDCGARIGDDLDVCDGGSA